MTRVALILAVALISTALGQAPEAAPAKPASSGAIQQRTPPPARITEFRAQPASIQPGQSATLVWATENPSGVTIDPEPGRVTPRGTRPVAPKATTTYTLTVRGPNHTVLTREVTVTVAGTTAVAAATAVAAGPKLTPRMPDGKPDFTGVYNFGGGGGSAGRGARTEAGRR